MALVAITAVPALAAVTLRKKPPKPHYGVSLNVSKPAFSVANMRPGDYLVRCLRVRNESTATAQMFGFLQISGPLSRYLLVHIDEGRGLGSKGPSCAGFIPSGRSAFGAAGLTPASKLTPVADNAWPAHATKSYRVTILLWNGAGRDAQNLTSNVTYGFAVAAAKAKPKPPARRCTRYTIHHHRRVCVRWARPVRKSRTHV